MITCKEPTVPKMVGGESPAFANKVDPRSFRIWDQDWIARQSSIETRAWLWDDPNKVLKYYRYPELLTAYDPNLEMSPTAPPAVACGVLSSLETFKYGYFEAICQIPNGPFQWPGFWLWRNSENKYTEIDIFEGYSGWLGWYGWPCRKLEGRLWYGLPKEPLSTINPVKYPVHPFSRLKQRHRFGMRWTESLIEWSFDSKPFHSITDPAIVSQFDQEMTLVFSAYVQEKHARSRRVKQGFQILDFHYKPL